jgi:RHS repeat-associated protein
VNGVRRVTHKTPIGNTSGGRQTIYDFIQDAAGLMTHTTTFPDGSTETRISDPQGKEKTTAKDGTVIESTLAAASQFGGVSVINGTTTKTLPSSLTQTIKRNVSDPIGGPRISTVTYDDTVIPNVKDTTTTTYDANSQTIVYDSPEGRRTTTKLNAKGQVTEVQIGSPTAGFLTSTKSVYTSGLLSSVTQGARVTSFTYAAAGLADAGYLFHVTDAASSVTEQSHDIRGRLLSNEAAFGTTNASKPTFTWFKNDVLKTVTTPELSKVHTFSYNAVKEIQQYLPPSLTGVANPATGYTYDADRNLLTETPAGLSQMSRTYIASSGQLDTITLPATTSDPGIPTLSGLLDYDYYTTNNSTGAAWGQISKITGPTSTNNVQYKYNGFLRAGITWAGDVSGSVAWTYNNRLWPNKETLTTTSSFDRFLGYDKDGLLVCNSPTTCNPAGNDALTLARSAIHGKVTSVAAGGVSETWKYSDTNADYIANPSMAYGELREQVATLSGTTFADLVYDAPGSSVSERRDAKGRIRFKTETFRDATGAHNSVTNRWEYLYDERGQLKTVKLGPAGSSTTVFDATYDKNGNIKTVFASGVTGTVTVDEQDRVKSYTVGGTTVLSLQYNDNGEVKQKNNGSGPWKYYYDAQSRLRVVVDPAGTQIEYILDGEGRRIAKKVTLLGQQTGTIKRKWIYGSGLSPIAEIDDTGTVSRFIYGSRTNTPDLVIRGTTIYRLISDQLGTPRYAVKVGATNVVPYVGDINDVPYEAVYTAFGAPTAVGGLPASSLSWIPFGFAGGLYDADTGLVHFGAREYDPEIGRWMSKDPIRFAGGQTNIYVYVGNDPINRRDPLGLNDKEFGNFLKCTGNILKCALVCDVASVGCYSCLASVFGDLDGSSCYKPFGFPDPPDPPPPLPDCPAGTHRGLPGWGNAVCEPDDCSDGHCVCE